MRAQDSFCISNLWSGNINQYQCNYGWNFSFEIQVFDKILPPPPLPAVLLAEVHNKTSGELKWFSCDESASILKVEKKSFYLHIEIKTGNLLMRINFYF